MVQVDGFPGMGISLPGKDIRREGEMIELLSREHSGVVTEQYRNTIDQTIRFLKDYGIDRGYLLDVGGHSPMTDELEVWFDFIIDHTEGDLDEDFKTRQLRYDYILYSHVIEHQFNPLHTLLRLRERMDAWSQMVIVLPRRPKFLWDKQHFHEIDHYRMQLLLERAKLEIRVYEEERMWRGWRSVWGIRSLIRMFMEYNAFYLVVKI